MSSYYQCLVLRPVATDKRAFYLLNTTDRGFPSEIPKAYFFETLFTGPQIYELLANGAGEREKWIKYITEASTAYKSGMPKAKSEPEALAAKAVDGTRRPASFRDKTSSPRLERPDRQNSSPPEGLNIPRKEDEEDNAPTTPKKRLQRVEILKIVDSTPMIEPSQVHVNTPTVLVADPVVTPFEKLRQKDEEVSRILEEKQRIISEILHIPEEDFETIADIASSTAEAREAREILLAALSQAKSLTHFVNSSLRVGEEDLVARGSPAREPSTTSGSLLGPAGDQLIAITASMNQHLTDLLAVMSERDEERELLRRQLAKSQDQIRGFFRFFKNSRSPLVILFSSQVRLCPVVPVPDVRLATELVHLSGKRGRGCSSFQPASLSPLTHRVRRHRRGGADLSKRTIGQPWARANVDDNLVEPRPRPDPDLNKADLAAPAFNTSPLLPSVVCGGNHSTGITTLVLL